MCRSKNELDLLFEEKGQREQRKCMGKLWLKTKMPRVVQAVLKEFCFILNIVESHSKF